MEYFVKGFFTDRSESPAEAYGFCDNAHWQWSAKQTFDSKADTRVELKRIVLDVLAENLNELGNSGKAISYEDGDVIAIHYDDGDISTYKVVKSSS